MKKYLPYVFLLIALALASSNLIQKINYSPDDTYIYMQYARNLAAGNGFSFNAGEPSYGITSPVWSVIISGGYLFGLDGYWFAKFADLFFLLISLVMFYKLAGLVFNKYYGDKETVTNLKMLALSAFIMNSWLIRWSFTGMETSLAVFIVLAIFYFLFRERFISVFCLLGIFFLVRPESFVLFFLLAIFLLLRKTPFKKFVLCILVYGFIVSLFLVYAKITFGTIFPNTTLGKATFSFGISIYIEQFKRIFQIISLSNIVELALSILFVFLLLRRRQWNPGAILLLWPAGLIFLYVITDADIISRYLLIIIPFIILTGITVLGRIKSKYSLITLVVFLVIAFQSQFVFYKYVKPHTDNFTYGVQNCFVNIAEFLRTTDKKDKILVNDVGAIGYYSNRYIIDAAALINRNLNMNKEIMQVPPEQRENTANLLKITDADWVIVRDKDKGNKISKIGDFSLDYIREWEFPSLGITDPSPRYYKIYKVNRPKLTFVVPFNSIMN